MGVADLTAEIAAFRTEDEIMRDAVYAECLRLLENVCNESEREGFVRIWPKGLPSVPSDKRGDLLRLLQRSLKLRHKEETDARNAHAKH